MNYHEQAPEVCPFRSFLAYRAQCVAKGFTLSELLVSLAILGVIATFTIPKVLQAQQNSAYKSKAKEAVEMVSSAYQIYRSKNTVGSLTSFHDMTPYVNYVRFTNALTPMDGPPSQAPVNCGTAVQTFPCIILHNGAVLRYRAITGSFGGTATTNAIWFMLDPDGIENNDPADGKSFTFYLYTTGRVVDSPNVLPGTRDASGLLSAVANPAWFDWN